MPRTFSKSAFYSFGDIPLAAPLPPIFSQFLRHYKKIKKVRKKFCFLLRFRYRILKELRRHSMATSLECPICEADIPLDGDEKSGDLVQCSYCKITLKILRTKDKWILVEDFEE